LLLCSGLPEPKSYLCFLPSWNDKCVPLHRDLLVEMGSCGLLPGLVLNGPQSSRISASWVAGITAVSQHAWHSSFYQAVLPEQLGIGKRFSRPGLLEGPVLKDQVFNGPAVCMGRS
jgi:hypothetical protein